MRRRIRAATPKKAYQRWFARGMGRDSPGRAVRVFFGHDGAVRRS